MQRIAIFLIVLFSFSAINAVADTYSRQHESDIAAGKKGFASHVNNELNAIQTVINGNIDGDNIQDGTLVGADYASNSSGYIGNRKLGCELRYDSTTTTSLNINLPCAIVMDGSRGELQASGSIDLASDLDTGSVAANTFYFIYAKITSGVLSFQGSTTGPLVSTGRKQGDTTYKYLGTVRTLDSSAVIAQFDQQGNKFFFRSSSNPTGGLTYAATTSASNHQFTVPNHFKSAYLKFAAQVGTAPGICGIQAESNIPALSFTIGAGTGTDRTGIFPIPVDLNYTGTAEGIAYLNTSNCSGVTYTLFGWEDPPEFHN